MIMIQPGVSVCSERKEFAGTLLRPRMHISAGGGNTGVSERGLHQMNGRAPVQGLGGMGMPQPVRRHRQLQTGALGCPSHNPPDRRFGERVSLLPPPKKTKFVSGLPPPPPPPAPPRHPN